MIARGSWEAARDTWLEHVATSLGDDIRVSGWGLVGSFGRGQQDEWSDLDILVTVVDGEFGAFTDGMDNVPWSSADVFIDARRNAPASARAASTIHVVSGLPVGTDWYVYPRSVAAWPVDCVVRDDRGGIPRTTESFDAWNGRGPRGAPLPTSESLQAQARLAMVLIAAKYVVRGSAQGAPMLEFLGAKGPGSSATDLLESLNDLVDRLAVMNALHVVTAMRAHLEDLMTCAASTRLLPAVGDRRST